jgi:hypothetical protein
MSPGKAAPRTAIAASSLSIEPVNRTGQSNRSIEPVNRFGPGPKSSEPAISKLLFGKSFSESFDRGPLGRWVLGEDLGGKALLVLEFEPLGAIVLIGFDFG